MPKTAYIRKGVSLLRTKTADDAYTIKNFPKDQKMFKCPSCFCSVPLADAHESTRVVDAEGNGYAVCQGCHTNEKRVSQPLLDSSGKALGQLVHTNTGDRDIDCLYDTWRYTCCGYTYTESRVDEHATELTTNYCPNCGAKII